MVMIISPPPHGPAQNLSGSGWAAETLDEGRTIGHGWPVALSHSEMMDFLYTKERDAVKRNDGAARSSGGAVG
jgi:hypothetical protein